MASKEATEVKKPEVVTFAFEFTLQKDKIGDKTTNPQVKSKVGEAFTGFGAHDETRVAGAVGEDRTVTVFFARLFAKGQAPFDALKKGEKVTQKIYDEDVELRLTDAKPSGGGATTGTSSKPKKEGAKKGGKKPEGGKREAGKDGAPAGAAGAAGKDGAKEEGKRAARPKRDEEKKIDSSLQRGRANIGGKLGPVSKVRLAKIAKEAREKENAARIARGEEPLPDPTKKSKHDDDDSGLPPKKGAKEAAKGGKKEAPKGKAAAPAKKK